MAAAAQEEMLDFHDLNEAQLRQWMEANPGRVNDRDGRGHTPLYVAVFDIKSLPLTVWLLDEKEPASPDNNGTTPLMIRAICGDVEMVVRFLQDPRVRASNNVKNKWGKTVLHEACDNMVKTSAAFIVHLLLQAGANVALTNNRGETPLEFLRQNHPSHHAAIALEQYPEAQKDAEKSSLLVKASRLVVLSRGTAMPSYLQGRVARGQPLPRVTLMPMVGDQNEDEDEDEDEESRKLRTLMAFLLGVEGGWENAGMPRDVFRVVLDLLMPSWDPLRRKNAGAAPPLVQQG